MIPGIIRFTLRWTLALHASIAVSLPVIIPAESRDQSEATGDVAEPSPSNIPETKIAMLKYWESVDNPEADGWTTEAFDLAAGKTLKKLELILGGEKEDVEAVFCPNLKVRFLAASDGTVTFFKSGGFTSRFREETGGKLEAFTFRDSVTKLRQRIGWIDDTFEKRFKAKVIDVELEPGSPPHTLVRVETAGFGAQNSTEAVSYWRIEWESLESDEPRIAQITEVSHDGVVRQHSPRGGKFFVDATFAALSKNQAYETQVLRSVSHWLERGRTKEFYGYTGLAVGDVNGDGLEDFYTCESLHVPNLLFVQNADGTFAELAAKWGIDWVEDTRSALFLDLDNDGDQDLALATDGWLVVAENRGADFEYRSAMPGCFDATHLCAADFDLDGFLDLYVAGYYPMESEQLPSDSLYPQLYLNAELGEPNRLYRNLIGNSGTWEFQEVTDSAGLEEGNRGMTLGAAWEDYDQDGDPDLYVANDFGRNMLYQNQGDGSFREVSREASSEDNAFGMSASWGDPNRDGWLDLYVSNMWSSAGKRVTGQAKFKPGIGEEDLGTFQRLARGNTLLINAGNGSFDDVSEDAGVTMGRWAWGSPFVDFNNDGWEDLFVANGFITGPGPGDL